MPVLSLPPDPPAAQLPNAGEAIIFDMEWTSWEGSHARGWGEPWEWREVVQIGAVRVDAARGFEELDRMEALVRPRRNPELSAYFTALTGITNADLAARGGGFSDVMARFADFCGPSAPIFMNGLDGLILRENCAFADAPFPLSTARFFNLRPLLARVTGLAPGQLVSSDLPALFGLAPPKDAHTGLADARAIAAALAELRRQGKA